MTKPGPSVTSGADTQPGSDSLFPSGFGGGSLIRSGGVGTTEIADGSIALVDLSPAVTNTLPLTTPAVSTATTGTLTVGATHRLDATGAPLARTLPSAASAGAGGIVIVKKVDATSNAVTVTASGADTINVSGSTRTLTLPREAAHFRSDGVSDWTVVASDTPVTQLDSRYDARYVTPATGNGTYVRTDVQLADPTGGDDSTWLNTALTAAAGRYVRLMPGKTYLLNTATLVIPSGTTLDLCGSTLSAPDTARSIVKNASAGSTTTRDSNIVLRNGYISAGAGSNSATHRVFLNRIDGLRVQDITVTTTLGKYSILLADVSSFVVSNIQLANSNSDGVHVTGPAKDGVIRDIFGYTGDDFVALGCTDFPAYDYSRGDITNVTVERLRPETTAANGSGVSMFITADASYTTDTLAMTGVTVRDVKGKVGQSGVKITDVVANANCIHRAPVIDDISVVQNNAGFGQVLIDAKCALRAPRVSNVHIPASQPGTAYGVYITATGAMTEGITIDGLRSSHSAATGRGVKVSTASPPSIRLANCDWRAADTASVFVQSDTAAIPLLELIGCRVSGANADMVWLNSNGSATRIRLVGCSQTTTGFVVDVANNSATPDIVGVGVYAAGTAIGITGTSATATVKGSGWDVSAGAGVFRSASQTFRSLAQDFSVDVAKTVPQDGDRATNTNAGSATVGPVVRRSGAWSVL